MDLILVLGKDNAYCKVKVADSKERTRVIKDSNSPVWDEDFSFAVKKLDESVKVEVFHHKKGASDAFLGQYKFTVREVAERGEVDSWFTLQKRSKSSKVKGKIHLRITWDGYQVPTDLFVFVREARNIANLTKKSSLITSLRFGDYESQTQTATGVTPKWEEAIQFPWDEKAKEMLVEVRDDVTGEKLASTKVSTKSIDDTMRKGQWYELKGKSGKGAEIFLKLSFDEEGKPKEEKKKMRKKGSSASLEPAVDLIGAAEQMDELPDMSEAGSNSDEDTSDIEDSLSASGHFKKKKGFLDRFKAASEQGKIYIRDLEATITGAPSGGGQGKKGVQFVVEFVFEKQNLITEPKSGAAPKWKESDFMFTVKELTSEVKVKIWEIPPGTVDAVLATETKSNLIGIGKVTLQKLENAPKLKDTFTIPLTKLEKDKYSGTEIKCSIQFLPTVILDEEDFEEEQLPPDLQDSSPLGKLEVEVMGARDLAILEGKSTCDAFFSVDCQGQTYSSSPIPDNTTPEFAEIWTWYVLLDGEQRLLCFDSLRLVSPLLPSDIVMLENSRLLVSVWDHDAKSGKDELLGAVKIPISEVVDGREILKWFPLGRKQKMSTVSGDIQLKIKYTGKAPKRGGNRSRRGSEAGASASDESSGLSRRRKSSADEENGLGGSEDEPDRRKSSDVLDDDDDDSEDPDADLPEDVVGHVFIQVDEARDLKKPGTKMDSYVTVRLADDKFKTKTVKGTTMPKFGEETSLYVGFSHPVTFATCLNSLASYSPVTDMLSDVDFSVWSLDKSGEQTFIGKASIGIETLAENDEVHEDWFPLKADDKGKGKDAKNLQPAIHLRLQFKKRVFKPKKPGQLVRGTKASLVLQYSYVSVFSLARNLSSMMTGPNQTFCSNQFCWESLALVRRDSSRGLFTTRLRMARRLPLASTLPQRLTK